MNNQPTTNQEPEWANLIEVEVKNERGRVLATVSSGQPYSIIRVLSTHITAERHPGDKQEREAVLACSWTKTEYTIKEGESFDFHIQHRLIRVTVVSVFADRAVINISTQAGDMYGKLLAPMAMRNRNKE